MARTHGTTSGYVAGCRCEPCRTAIRESQRRSRGSKGRRTFANQMEQAFYETSPEFFRARIRA